MENQNNEGKKVVAIALIIIMIFAIGTTTLACTASTFISKIGTKVYTKVIEFAEKEIQSIVNNKEAMQSIEKEAKDLLGKAGVTGSIEELEKKDLSKDTQTETKVANIIMEKIATIGQQLMETKDFEKVFSKDNLKEILSDIWIFEAIFDAEAYENNGSYNESKSGLASGIDEKLGFGQDKSENDVPVGYYVAFGIEGLILMLTIMYLAMTKGCKITIKKAFENKNKLIITIVVVLVGTGIITVGIPLLVSNVFIGDSLFF